MATRSRIGIEKADGTIRSIYCHWDGYPAYNGRILLENYTNREKVEGLIALGDISVLGKELAPGEGVEHSFDNRSPGVTIAYPRDRGDVFNQPRENFSLEGFANSEFGEFGYVFTKENKWKLIRGKNRITDLTPEIVEQDL